MNRIRTLVVDDEPLAREGLLLLLRRESDIEVVATCADGHSATQYLQQHRVDLAFLDVQMPVIGGIDILARLPAEARPAVIFVTAYDRYAVQAFEISAVDYLLKPFRDDRFRTALTRAREHLGNHRLHEKKDRLERLVAHMREWETTEQVLMSPPSGQRGSPGRMVFKVGSDHLFVATEDIAWLEAKGEHVKLGTAGETHLVRESLQAIEKRLDPTRFVRTHRSFIVNVACVKRITPTMYGDYDLLTTDGARLRMSRTFRDKLPQLLAAAT